MELLAIYGAGGLGRLVLDITWQAGVHRPACFLDSDPQLRGQVIDGLPVLGGLEALPELAAAGVRHVIVAVGDNVARLALADQLEGRGFELASAVHPLASIALSAQLGAHVIIGPRVTVCVHACIGAHTVLSAGSIAEHDTRLGRAVFLHPAVRLAGGVQVDDFATLEIGAAVTPGRRIGASAIVRAAAVIIADVPPGGVVSGVPARGERCTRSRFVPDGARAT